MTNDLTLAARYIYHWFQYQPITPQEVDAFWRYLALIKPHRFGFTPEDAFEAAKEYFAYELPKWKASNPSYVALSEQELWEKLDNHYYNFLRKWRAAPSREHKEVVCSAYEASERTEENSETLEARDVSSGDVVREGAPEALDLLRSLYALPSVHYLAAEGGLGGAMIARLLVRRLPPARTLELLLRILITHPIALPTDLKKYRKPLVAHIARNYWANGREGLVDQKTMAGALNVTTFEISTAKDSPELPPASFTPEDVERELSALEIALDQEWIRIEKLEKQ